MIRPQCSKALISRPPLADRLVTEDSRKWSWKVSKCLVDVGIADATCAHLHQHLTGSGLRLRDIFDLPRTAHGGYDRSFHGASSWHDSMRVPLCWVHDFTSPTANRTHKLRLTIRELSHGGSSRNGEYGPFCGMCVIVPNRLAGTCEAIPGL